MTTPLDICGQRFGRLVALSRAGSKNGRALWRFSCDCGRHHTAQAKLVKDGHTKSCGCLAIDTRTKHGFCGTRLYRVWSGIIQRCTNPNSDNFHLYGGRGISICEEWREFSAFARWCTANGYSEGLEIDREKVNGNYEPSNCRFVTRKINARNRRCTAWIKLDRGLVSMAEASEIASISPSALRYRIHVMGMTPQEAVTRPKAR